MTMPLGILFIVFGVLAVWSAAESSTSNTHAKEYDISCPEDKLLYGKGSSIRCQSNETIKLQTLSYKGAHQDIDYMHEMFCERNFCVFNVNDDVFPPPYCNDISMYYVEVKFQCSDQPYVKKGHANETINLSCNEETNITSANATLNMSNPKCFHCRGNVFPNLNFSSCIGERNCTFLITENQLKNDCLLYSHLDLYYCCIDTCDPYPESTAYEVRYSNTCIEGKYPHGTELNVTCKDDHSSGWKTCSDGRWLEPEDICPPNIALGKTANQSSDVLDYSPASRAVDGNLSPVLSHNSCTHTGADNNSWWQVDLEQDYTIHSVTLVNTNDTCCVGRLRTATIRIGKNYSESPFEDHVDCGNSITRDEAFSGRAISRTCNGTLGRYVSVQLNYTGRLQLCEVLVFGEISDAESANTSDHKPCVGSTELPTTTEIQTKRTVSGSGSTELPTTTEIQTKRTVSGSDLTNLSKEPVTADNVHAVAKNLADIIAKLVDDSEAVDIQAVQNIFVNIVDVGSPSENITEHLVQSIDCIHNLTIDTDSQSDVSIANSTSLIVKAAEEQISQTLKKYGTFRSLKPNVVVNGSTVADIQDGVKKFAIARNNLGIVESKSDGQDTVIAIHVPENALVENNDTISFISYKDDTLFRSEMLGKTNTTRVLGPIISADVLGKTTKNLAQPVVIRVTPTKDEAAHSFRCVFWDFDLRNGIGDWAEDGCKLIDSNEVTCHCDHLTNFAVLVDVTGGQGAGKLSFVLDVISKVGCAVSIVALCVTLLIFLLASKLRMSLQRKILVQFCFAMLFLYLSFLIGIDSKSQSGCFLVGLLLHYFVLATIFWMGVEARHMYITLVSESDRVGRHFLIKAGIFAWGGALIPVGVVAAVKQDEYIADTYCFLAPNYGLYFGLLFPIAVVLLHNIATFIVVAKKLLSAKSYKMKPDLEAEASGESSSGDVGQRLLNAFAVSIVLGITWVFGFLAVEEAKGAFQLLFCIFNSFQGVLIFILFCYAQKDVRKLLSEKCCVDMVAPPMPKEPKKVVKHAAENKGQTVESGSTLVTGETVSDENNTLVTNFDEATIAAAMAKSSKEDKEELELQENTPDANVTKKDENGMNHSTNTEETTVNLNSDTDSAERKASIFRNSNGVVVTTNNRA